MSSNDENNDTLSTASYTDINVPKQPDGSPIIWDGVDAHIPALMTAIKKFYKRVGLFQALFKHHAVVLSNGKLAVDSPESILFTSGTISDPDGKTYDFDDPCPPTCDRYASYNADARAKSETPKSPAEASAMIKDTGGTVLVAAHAVEAEDGRLLRSLSNAFGNAEPSEELLDSADGSGLKLLKLLCDRAHTASRKDKALASATHARIIREGVRDELRLDTFKAFLKEYKQAKANVPTSAQQPDEAEAEMINLIAMRDPNVRDVFDIKATAKPPSNLDEASTMLIEILRGKARDEQIDEATTGAKPVLAATKTKGESKNGADAKAVKALLAALGLNGDATAALAALVAAQPDPKRGEADGKSGKPGAPNKNGVVPPRDKKNKITHWIEGMGLCKCGINGGKHLFRDCPDKDRQGAGEKASKDKEKKAAAKALAAQSKSNQSELLAALQALLGTDKPTKVVVDGSQIAECEEE